MSEKNINTAIGYYMAINNKDVANIDSYLHDEIRLISPLSEIKGKKDVLEAIEEFIKAFNGLKIHKKFSAANQVVLIYDLDCPQPIGIVKVASLMTFKEDLIATNELFFDARPFELS